MFTNIGFYQGTGQVKVLCGVMHAQQLFSVVIGQVAHWHESALGTVKCNELT